MGRRLLRDNLDISISIYSSTLDGLRFTYQIQHSFQNQAWGGKVYWVVTEQIEDLTCEEVRNFKNPVDENCYGSDDKKDERVYHVTLKCGFIPSEHYFFFIASDTDGMGGHCVNYLPHGEELVLGATSPPSTSAVPSRFPSINPSVMPTISSPTDIPTKSPFSSLPTFYPSPSDPTTHPITSNPTSSIPTLIPSYFPTFTQPSQHPIHGPTRNPTIIPSKAPLESEPSHHPTFSLPTFDPTPHSPSSKPVIAPAKLPTVYIYQEDITFPFNYDEVIGNKSGLFLKECSRVVMSECILVMSGSIILTLEGKEQDVKDDIRNITADCLHVPDFPQMCLSSEKRSEGTLRSRMSGHNPWIWMLLGTLCCCIMFAVYPFIDVATHKERSIKDDLTQDALIEDLRRVALQHKDEIVLRSQSVENCVDRMNDFIDTYADHWVKRDPTLKAKPEAQIRSLKEELSQVFRVACKLSQMLIAAREFALTKLDSIVDKATSESECVQIMKREVDDFCTRFMSQDDFFKIVPLTQVEAAKTELMQSFGMHLPTASIYS